MISIETRDGESKKFVLDGTPIELTADICVIIRAVYTALANDSEDVADVFKKCLTWMIATEGSVFERMVVRADDKNQQ